MILYFVLTDIWFHSFTRFRIKVWPFASSLWTFDFIISSASWFNFDLLFRLYDHFISFFHSLPDWIFPLLLRYYEYLISFFSLVQRFHFLSSASTLRIRDCILSSAPRLKFNLLFRYDFILSPASRLKFDILLRYYAHLISFFQPLPD